MLPTSTTMPTSGNGNNQQWWCQRPIVNCRLEKSIFVRLSEEDRSGSTMKLAIRVASDLCTS